MAKGKFWQNGEALDYLNSSGAKIEANTIVQIGKRIGIAGADIPNGEVGAVIVKGVFELPKDYGDSGKALTLGQEVYWDNANSCIKAAVAQVVTEGAVTTEASAVNGYVVKAALTTDQTVLVSINA